MLQGQEYFAGIARADESPRVREACSQGDGAGILIELAIDQGLRI
jgi:hypothetical protein